MNSGHDNRAIWVLADDRPGNVAQALGVAEALGQRFEIKPVNYTMWGRLHNALRATSRRGLTRWSRKSIEQMPPPDLVIGAGRRTAPLARWFKRRFGSRLVQIMDPGWPGRAAFDLIATPLHDDLPAAANVIHTLGACHRATPAMLAAEAAKWRDRLPDLPRPWTLLAVGGASERTGFDAADARALAAGCRDFPGSLLVITSRRSGRAVEQALRESLPDAGYFHGWRAGEDSPYLGLLALADRIVVTGDSMSMCTEACANGGPVHIFVPPGIARDRKFGALHRQLYEQGYAVPLGGAAPLSRHAALSSPRAPLNAAGQVAAEIRARALL